MYVKLLLQFYFGDKNLPRDKFLRQKVDEDEGCILSCTHVLKITFQLTREYTGFKLCSTTLTQLIDLINILLSFFS